MTNAKLIETAISGINLIYTKVHAAFPYEDCYRILELESNYSDLIPDLDMYFSEIAGYCSWGKGILKWSNEKLIDVKSELEISFFQRHSKYLPLSDELAPSMQTGLAQKYGLYEDLRSRLLNLLNLILEGRDYENGAE